jgi:hypothetical protein
MCVTITFFFYGQKILILLQFDRVSKSFPKKNNKFNQSRLFVKLCNLFYKLYFKLKIELLILKKKLLQETFSGYSRCENEPI